MNRCLTVRWSLQLCYSFAKDIVVSKKTINNGYDSGSMHVVSYYCEATASNETIHTPLIIICVTNVTKYLFRQSGPVQSYTNFISIFLKFHFKILIME